MVALELEIFTDMLQRLEKVSGEVRVSFRKQDIVRVSKDGNMVIDTKGVRGVSLAQIYRVLPNASPKLQCYFSRTSLRVTLLSKS